VDRLRQTADPLVGTGTLWVNGRLNAAAAVGPASCSPRPPVIVTSRPNGAGLTITVNVSGVGNAIRYLQVGPGGAQNAQVTFTGTKSEAQGTTSYVPSAISTTTTFQLQRQAPGQATTLTFAVVDGCGAWKSLVGGGTGAGF
jgi:hypothetical protein